MISTRVPGARSACTQARCGQFAESPIHSHHSGVHLRLVRNIGEIDGRGKEPGAIGAGLGEVRRNARQALAGLFGHRATGRGGHGEHEIAPGGPRPSVPWRLRASVRCPSCVSSLVRRGLPAYQSMRTARMRRKPVCAGRVLASPVGAHDQRRAKVDRVAPRPILLVPSTPRHSIEMTILTPSGAPADGSHVGYRVTLEPCARRIRGEFGGELIVDSNRALVMHETRLAPVYYFPRDDVRMDLMEKTAHRTHCPFKGNASYWTLKAGEREARNVVWGYEEPYDEAEGVRDFVAFYWDAMDAWFEDEAAAQRPAPSDTRDDDNPFRRLARRQCVEGAIFGGARREPGSMPHRGRHAGVTASHPDPYSAPPVVRHGLLLGRGYG